VAGVSKCSNGLDLPCAVLVGDFSPLPGTVLEVGERLIVLVFIKNISGTKLKLQNS
jgi:hypothetical protein